MVETLVLDVAFGLASENPLPPKNTGRRVGPYRYRVVYYDDIYIYFWLSNVIKALIRK